MRVLVTGSSGWIGRATCAQLVRRGHEAVSFDRSHGADVTRHDDLSLAVSRVDHVIHLAGVLGTHELFSNPAEAVEIACLEHDVGLTEITMPRVNPSLYAATKACAMDISEAYRHAEKLRVSYVRAYNAYGPGQAQGGDHPQKIIPTFATKAWRGEPLPIWGDGNLLCDLVHVEDVARMLVEAIHFTDGQVFDAGTSYGQTVCQVASRVLGITGSKAGIEFLEARPGERRSPTRDDVAHAEGWELLDGWHPIFDPRRFEEAVQSYR
jgi:UDP-glucose 4-epimerase